MTYTQKIYYNDKPLIVTTDSEKYFHEQPYSETYNFFVGASIRNFNQALQQLEVPGTPGCMIHEDSVVTLQECLHDLFSPVDAGGGVVYNEHGAILMIYRRGKWDLPKGKRDEGETMEDCALREVAEETGLQTLALEDKVCESYHVYSQDNELMLKRTVWYKMQATVAEKLKPQKEENIIEARWITEKELGQYVHKTYEAIKEVLKHAGLHW